MNHRLQIHNIITLFLDLIGFENLRGFSGFQITKPSFLRVFITI
nr:hypothetical protein [Elizabethkingia sp. ASV34]